MERLLSNEEAAAVRNNFLRICENIENAKAKANRSDGVRLMAVTKTVPVEKVNFAIGLGVDLLGENRVQEFMDKHEGYSQAEVHFIGSLQTNKVKYIIDKVSMIHSVDSLHLAEEISKRAVASGRVMDILTEINIGEEQTKGGITADSAREFCGRVAELDGVRLRGLMAIPPPGCDECVFAKMQELFESLKSLDNIDKQRFDVLSMGMSGDYQEAIKYGATIVRIGSGLFGQRKYI